MKQEGGKREEGRSGREAGRGRREEGGCIHFKMVWRDTQIVTDDF